jgi:hypothetical protein
MIESAPTLIPVRNVVGDVCELMSPFLPVDGLISDFGRWAQARFGPHIMGTSGWTDGAGV